MTSLIRSQLDHLIQRIGCFHIGKQSIEEIDTGLDTVARHGKRDERDRAGLVLARPLEVHNRKVFIFDIAARRAIADCHHFISLVLYLFWELIPNALAGMSPEKVFGGLSFRRNATRARRSLCMVALGGRASARPSFCGRNS